MPVLGGIGAVHRAMTTLVSLVARPVLGRFVGLVRACFRRVWSGGIGAPCGASIQALRGFSRACAPMFEPTRWPKRSHELGQCLVGHARVVCCCISWLTVPPPPHHPPGEKARPSPLGPGRRKFSHTRWGTTKHRRRAWRFSTKWPSPLPYPTETLQSDAEWIAVKMSSFQYLLILGPGRGNTRGAIQHVGDSMFARAARMDLWYADNAQSSRIACAGYVAMAVRFAR